MTPPDIYQVVQDVTQAFDRLGIPYQLTGSLASSAYGVTRSSLDVDLVAQLNPSHVELLVGHLSSRYYIEADEILEAIRHRSSFNLIHLASMYKVDVFVLREESFEQQAFQRRRRLPITSDASHQAEFPTPEDVVLKKLSWFQQGGCSSERQWQDVIGVLKVQRGLLDVAYLKRWAETLGVSDLLEQALQEKPF